MLAAPSAFPYPAFAGEIDANPNDAHKVIAIEPETWRTIQRRLDRFF